MIKVISRVLIRCLDQSSEEGTEGAACGIGAHLNRPIPEHIRIQHCESGPDATYGDKWRGSEWINDLGLARKFGLGDVSNGHARLGSSPKPRRDPQVCDGV